ncbi:membrane-spanning 4-domains subfamily A member 12 [Carlito syrichta]|uniref:Membrane-spanning 4-domains subfamily A member 12 n=1 Tax=Carlito syrichta TaxID=1868482 RepID=A0A1U7UTC9_CARSF|nr:membrane-spanning 4-domains subfamily A member 12 [Carlito syrichta]
MSSKPTSHAEEYGALPSPYPSSNFMSPGSQQPLGLVNPRNQGQGGQPVFITSPGVLAGSQLGQATTQTINPSTQTAAINFKEEAKTLGAIQIVIGLMHIGFGIILGLLSFSIGQSLGFASTAFLGGYPFWGGLSFIISGSLCVSASKEFSLCLIKGSLGMNIVSSIFAIIGVILLVVDMSINGTYYQVYWAVLSGKGISAILFLFSLLELSIACTTAHFANQTITNTNTAVLIVPNAYSNNPLPPELVPPRNVGYPPHPPAY